MCLTASTNCRRSAKRAATVELPRSVDALRNAAAAADAVLLVTHYYAPVPAIVHNAIDWLTMRWNGSELHDKPLAVMGYSADCYRGVWSHRQTGQHSEISESRIIEPITVGSLREAIAKLAGEVSTVDEPARASAFRRGAPKHGQLEPCGRQNRWQIAPWKVPFSPRSALPRSLPISREIQIVSRDTIAAPMLSPKTTAPVHGGATMSSWRDRHEPPSFKELP